MTVLTKNLKDKYNDEINQIYSLIKNEIEKIKSNNMPLNSNQLNDIFSQLPILP